jgi:hypothetical protein
VVVGVGRGVEDGLLERAVRLDEDGRTVDGQQGGKEALESMNQNLQVAASSSVSLARPHDVDECVNHHVTPP